MKKRIGIVDYGRGNLRSVQKALEASGAETARIEGPGGLERLDALVLPGVGAFGDGVRGLRERGLWGEIQSWLENQRPFLGICLGYQLLFDSSEENPGVPGLGFLRGCVRRFPSGPWKIPHMGWNRIRAAAPSPLFHDLPEPAHVYFVHSFYPRPEEAAIVTAECEYAGQTFAAAVGTGPVQAVQFHPEKSQTVGLRMLRNYLESL